MDLISLDNPVCKAYAFYSAILIIKMALTAMLTAVKRNQAQVRVFVILLSLFLVTSQRLFCFKPFEDSDSKQGKCASCLVLLGCHQTNVETCLELSKKKRVPGTSSRELHQNRKKKEENSRQEKNPEGKVERNEIEWRPQLRPFFRTR